MKGAGGTLKDFGRRKTRMEVSRLKNRKNVSFSHLRRPSPTGRGKKSNVNRPEIRSTTLIGDDFLTRDKRLVLSDYRRFVGPPSFFDRLTRKRGFDSKASAFGKPSSFVSRLTGKGTRSVSLRVKASTFGRPPFFFGQLPWLPEKAR